MPAPDTAVCWVSRVAGRVKESRTTPNVVPSFGSTVGRESMLSPAAEVEPTPATAASRPYTASGRAS